MMRLVNGVRESLDLVGDAAIRPVDELERTTASEGLSTDGLSLGPSWEEKSVTDSIYQSRDYWSDWFVRSRSRCTGSGIDRSGASVRLSSMA